MSLISTRLGLWSAGIEGVSGHVVVSFVKGLTPFLEPLGGMTPGPGRKLLLGQVSSHRENVLK